MHRKRCGRIPRGVRKDVPDCGLQVSDSSEEENPDDGLAYGLDAWDGTKRRVVKAPLHACFLSVRGFCEYARFRVRIGLPAAQTLAHPSSFLSPTQASLGVLRVPAQSLNVITIIVSECLKSRRVSGNHQMQVSVIGFTSVLIMNP